MYIYKQKTKHTDTNAHAPQYGGPSPSTNFWSFPLATVQRPAAACCLHGGKTWKNHPHKSISECVYARVHARHTLYVCAVCVCVCERAGARSLSLCTYVARNRLQVKSVPRTHTHTHTHTNHAYRHTRARAHTHTHTNLRDQCRGQRLQSAPIRHPTHTHTQPTHTHTHTHTQ